jgi:uncharacterized protein YbbC (DUF1343 family)
MDVDQVINDTIRGLQWIKKQPKRQRARLVELLHEALDAVQTDEESRLDYLTTIEHGVRKNALEGETCASFLERTQKATEAQA